MPFLLAASSKELPEGTVEPLVPFLRAHDNECAFLCEFAKMFAGTGTGTVFGVADLKANGFSFSCDPHMEDFGRSDFGQR